MKETDLLFEDIFKSLLNFSANFEIKYDYQIRYHKEDSYATYNVLTVNSESIYSFKRKLHDLGKEGFTILNKEIEKVNYEDRIDFLKEINSEIIELRHKVTEDVLVQDESEYGPREETKFHTFINYTLVPTSQERNNGHKKSILQKADDFANCWLDFINENSRKIEFLINQYELMPEPKSAIKDKNTICIFYSWQSDIDEERKIIWKGFNSLKKHLSEKGKTLVVESDMRGTSGSQDIPNTLFNKIREADIFLADVNLVGLSMYRDDEMPNSNVMIELGFAAAVLGWDRVLLAMNIKSHKIEQLPFDIRQRSILWYHTDKIEEFEKKLFVFVDAIIK
jgi:hypothetical protein